MLIPIILFILSSLVNLSTSCCAEKERLTSFLDAAVDLISKAKSQNISCPGEDVCVSGRALDCADLYKRGFNKSGMYAIYPTNRLTLAKRLDVYCDMTTDGGGWTVIQRRGDFKREDYYFFKLWDQYKNGFGNPKRDFWIGNNNIFSITNQKKYTVRFDLEDKDKKTAFAHYENFHIDDDFNSFTLHINGYSGTAGNAMGSHDGRKFSTSDRDNDLWTKGNCADDFKSGWWFRDCYEANLNGKYNNKTAGISWKTWRPSESLVKSEIKIRPGDF